MNPCQLSYKGRTASFCASINNTTPYQYSCSISIWYTRHHALATLPSPSSKSAPNTQVLIVQFYPSTNLLSAPAWLHKAEGRNYKSTGRSCLQDPDSLATTRVKALFSVTRRSFMCLKEWICFICCRCCGNQRNRGENEKEKTYMHITFKRTRDSRTERKLRRDSPV